MTCVYWTYIETLHPLGVNPFVGDKAEDMNEKKVKTNVGQSDVNLSLLALPSSRIPLVQGENYCLPCGGRALVS